MAEEQEQRTSKASSQPKSNEEPNIRSRVFFKENFQQDEPVIRNRVVMKGEKGRENK